MLGGGLLTSSVRTLHLAHGSPRQKSDLLPISGMLPLRIFISRSFWPTVIPFHFQSYWPVSFGLGSLLFLNYFFMF